MQYNIIWLDKITWFFHLLFLLANCKLKKKKPTKQLLILFHSLSEMWRLSGTWTNTRTHTELTQFYKCKINCHNKSFHVLLQWLYLINTEHKSRTSISTLANTAYILQNCFIFTKYLKSYKKSKGDFSQFSWYCLMTFKCEKHSEK